MGNYLRPLVEELASHTGTCADALYRQEKEGIKDMARLAARAACLGRRPTRQEWASFVRHAYEDVCDGLSYAIDEITNAMPIYVGASSLTSRPSTENETTGQLSLI